MDFTLTKPTEAFPSNSTLRLATKPQRKVVNSVVAVGEGKEGKAPQGLSRVCPCGPRIVGGQ